MAKYIVTVTPPTPNGDLHLGHLSGPFLGADVCARILRQKGHDVLLLSYSDDYQSYLLRKSRQTSQVLRDIALGNAEAIAVSLRSVDVHLDHFQQSLGNPYFLSEVNHYFALVEAAGDVVAREASIPFCACCAVHGYEGFGRATCNYCGSPSDASQCEACASVPRLEDMGPMRCVLCGQEMSGKPVKRLEWTIGRRYPGLRERYRRAHQRPALADYLAATLAREDDVWPLTRPGESAIPLTRHPDQPIHTWFSGLAGYRATLAEYLARNGHPELLSDWWSPATRLVQFLGFDCTYSHAVAYAALLGLEGNGPAEVRHFTNRFLKLDGEDFSTSRNHAVWVRDIAASHDADAVRLYTALHSPENAVENFSRADFQHWVEADYERRIIRGSWRSPPPGRRTSAASATVDGSRPILHEWRSASSLDSFSISLLARCQMQMLDVIDLAEDAERHRLWVLFAELGKAIHPRLSREIGTAVLRHDPEAQTWLQAALRQ